MFFKKQNTSKVIFHTFSSWWEENFYDIVVPAKHCMPSWWSKDNTTPTAMRRLKQCWEEKGFIKDPKYASNLNRCPGFADQFNNSWFLCAPSDVVIDIIDFEEWNFSAAIPNFGIHQHKSYESAGMLEFKQKQNLKFVCPFDIRTDAGVVDLMYIPATWHTNYSELGDMEILPGQMTINPSFGLPLNLNTIVTKEKDFISIKKGTVLAQLRFSKPVEVVVVRSEDESAGRWSGSFDRATDYRQHCKKHRGDINDS
jgi:hypothetical protein